MKLRKPDLELADYYIGQDVKWWSQTKEMIERGYRRFCKKHGLPIDRSPIEFQYSRNKRNKK